MSRELLERVEERLGRLASERNGDLRVLDVGCGRKSRLRFPESAHVTGVDPSEEALAANDVVDEKIASDVESLELPEAAYDVVFSFNVLEHLADPISVLDKLTAAVRPGGLVVLGLPNVASAKGVVTKATPFRFHVWWYRRIRGSKTAGLPGQPPFKTYLPFSLAPSSLRRYARSRGLEIEQLELYPGSGVAKLAAGNGYPPAVRLSWKALTGVMRIATLGRVDPTLTEMLIVLRRPA